MSAPARRRPLPRERGIALLLVVWLLALLAVIAGEFLASGRVKAAAEANKRDDLRALALAQAGYRLALATLDQEIAGIKLDEDGTLLLQAKGTADWVPAGASGLALEDGTASWRITAQDGLVNLNDPKLQRATLAALLEECGVGPGVERDTVIDSLLDWRDANREHRLNGAEEDWYQALDPPYSSKDGPLDVVEELLLVRGVTRSLFTGAAGEGKSPRPGLRDLVTVYPVTLNAWTAPHAVREATGREPAGQPSTLGAYYAILATGAPSGRVPPRSLRAVVQRTEEGGRRHFTLVYWNDTYFPP